jgi:hypothetical protein
MMTIPCITLWVGIHPDFKDMGGMDVVQFESTKFGLESEREFDLREA